MADLASTRVFGKLTVIHDAVVKGNAEITGQVIAGSFTGSGSGLTGTASLRATGTTKADVGLGSVDNYSRAHYDGRYLAKTATAASATKLASINTTFTGKYPITVNVNGVIYSHTDATFEGSTGTLTAQNIVSGGSITAAGDVTAFSDARIKTNIETIPDAIDKVSKLSGYTFDRTDIETSRQTGVIAQEVLEVLPEAVTGGPTEDDPDGHYSVAYGNLVGLLIEAIKEQQTQIDELKRRIG